MVFTDGLSGCFKTPCVVFAGHPSLRYGDVVHFMELWGKSSGNTVIFTGTCIHQMILSSLLLLILWVRNIIRRRWRRMKASIWTIILNPYLPSRRPVWENRGQDSPIQTGLAWLIRCLLYGKNKNNSIRSMLLVCTNWFHSSKFCSSSLLFFSHQLFSTYRNKYC